MKYVHNFRLRVSDSSKELLEKLFSELLIAATIKIEEAQIKIEDDGSGTFFQAELWLDRQQPVRKMVNYLKSKIERHDIEKLKANPAQVIDIQTHCFLRFSKDQLLQGKWHLSESGAAANVRLNLAAYPATKEVSVKLLEQLLNVEKI